MFTACHLHTYYHLSVLLHLTTYLSIVTTAYNYHKVMGSR